MVASGNAAPIANTKPALMKTTTGAALEAYHKELAEAQKQVGLSGSQWESMEVCRCDREIRSNYDMQTSVYVKCREIASEVAVFLMQNHFQAVSHEKKCSERITHVVV